nr:hypothetical protein [Mycolicibacterium duvalii]
MTASASPVSGRLRGIVLALLGVDGVFSALIAVFFLPLRVGGIPLPVSALLSGLINVALVWAALQWTTAPRLAALPLWTWLATVLVCTFGGPGDDIIFGGVGLMEYGPLLLIAVGGLPPAWVLTRRTAQPGAGGNSGARVR